MHKDFKVTKAQAYPLGVSFCKEGMHVVAVCDHAADNDTDEFGIVLYDRKHRGGVRIPFPRESRVGAVYGMMLSDYHDRDCKYLFYCSDRLWQDPYCRKLDNPYRYGAVRNTLPACMVSDESYDWENDSMPGYPYEDVILYALHVRGFTKHRSSGVRYRGTFRGITEKTEYLKELGISSVLLMPCYEFDEIMDREPAAEPATMEQAAASFRKLPSGMDAEGTENEGTKAKKHVRLNYWGYQEGLYYVPKSSYAYSADAVTEYKDMVKELHRNGIEVLMQFYFSPRITTSEMLNILRYWVLEYHIDGFHVMGVDLPIRDFASDPLLCSTKILTIQQYSPEEKDHMAHTRRLGWLDDGFMFNMRRAVKGDDNMIDQLIFHVRNNRPENGIINYVAKWDGMRLADMVSYDRKHNEPNGEANQDGTDYNCSWNCGVEGKSRRKSITELRLRQMKNALSLVFLSQGTPLLYSGDEFGNTQEGNNNPYCQDNAVAGVKWNRSESGEDLLAYTKMLIGLRKAHSVLRGTIPLKGMDYLSCGYPDISFHGHEAWRPDTSPASRSIGIMYCCSYGEASDVKEDMLIYIGINLYWTAYYFGLPQLPKGWKWTFYASTDLNGSRTEAVEDAAQPVQEICAGPRTVVIYMAQKGDG